MSQKKFLFERSFKKNQTQYFIVYVTIAAGNAKASANNYSPSRDNGDGILTISAFGSGDIFASFSNFTNPTVDFSCPGVSVYSTYKNGGYLSMSGTSMAAPYAAGIVLARLADGLSGIPASDGVVKSDPDGTPDMIAHR